MGSGGRGMSSMSKEPREMTIENGRRRLQVGIDEPRKGSQN